MQKGVWRGRGKGAEGRGSAATDVGANLRTTKIKWQQENKSLFAQTPMAVGSWGHGPRRRLGVGVAPVGRQSQRK